jgi:tetratricopeptide (TPR) repeat protein
MESAAEWAGLEQTAEWHRRLGRVLRDVGCYEAALKHFEKAVSIDPGMWLAKAGIALIYILQEKYQEALDCNEAALMLAEADDRNETKDKDYGLWSIYLKSAECYAKLSAAIEEGGDKKQKVRLLKLALENYKKAFSFNDTDFTCVEKSLGYLYDFAYSDDLTVTEADGSTNEDLKIPTERECLEQIMELLHLLNDTDKGETTNLVKYLHKNMYDDDSLFEIIACAASDLEELEWLQSKYVEAIAFAGKNRLPVISANLAVCLGRLYGIYGNEEERAVRLWEAVGTERITSTALASDIGYARTTALNNLGQYYIRKAIKNDLNADRYIMKMERIVAKRRYGARMGTEDSVPPNDVAIYLAAWYHKVGRDEEAREIVKPHIRDALMILSDDDPSNDMDGFWDISRALVAVGDDVNAVAAFHAIRNYEDGKAVIQESLLDDPTVITNPRSISHLIALANFLAVGQ